MDKIDVKHVSFFYGDFQALQDISMAIEKNQSLPLSDLPVVESLLFSACSTA